MTFRELFRDYSVVRQGNAFDEEVAGLFLDSRKIVPRGVFFARKGTQIDGHEFIEKAIGSGVLALVVENMERVPESFQGAVVETSQLDQDMGEIASKFFHHPSHEMTIIGITGTNGKTSSAYMLEHLLNQRGSPTGVIGTIDHHLGEKVWATNLTTPDSISLHSRLRDFLEEGAKAVVMEVSSIAVDQLRISGVAFDHLIFTNLTQDHLDYHGSMEAYFAAKASLFNEVAQKASLVKDVNIHLNMDDSSVSKLSCYEGAKVWSYGVGSNNLNFKVLGQGLDGSLATFNREGEEETILVPSPGFHNVYNMAGCLSVVLAMGGSLPRLKQVVEGFKGIPGRLQLVDKDSSVKVFVDYAHTPDALAKVLSFLRGLKDLRGEGNPKLICVFGCGGDRDKEKRPLMGKIVEESSDVIVVTSDNPRFENPKTIINEILSGISVETSDWNLGEPLPRLLAISNRRVAIESTILGAQPGDVVLIAGKGHEAYQDVKGNKHSFSDFKEANAILNKG